MTFKNLESSFPANIDKVVFKQILTSIPYKLR